MFCLVDAPAILGMFYFKYYNVIFRHLYWGEYPLSFAACLSEHECFRLLCAYGANPNWQDTNGNNVFEYLTFLLHVCF